MLAESQIANQGAERIRCLKPGEYLLVCHHKVFKCVMT